MSAPVTRRRLSRVAATAIAASLATANRLAAEPPYAPIDLHVMDAIGNLSLSRDAFETYRRMHPDRVAKIVFHEAPSARLPDWLAPESREPHPPIDLLLAGSRLLDGLTGQDRLVALLPAYAGGLPDLPHVLRPDAWAMQRPVAQGVVIAYSLVGPVLQYSPSRLPDPPRNAPALLDWVRAHPGRFSYGRPAKSEAGRAFLTAAPYLLGDPDPADPVSGWPRTWPFLQALGAAIDTYPYGDSLAALEAGQQDICVTTIGSSVIDRVNRGPAMAPLALDGQRWIGAAHFAAIPAATPEPKRALLVDLIAFLLSPAAQETALDQLHFYPGPAIAALAPPNAPHLTRQGVITPEERRRYDELIATRPAAAPLAPEKLAYAIRRWNEQIGGAKI